MRWKLWIPAKRAKNENWDTAYTERRQWDGGSTNLNASTARTNLGLTGDVSTHHHDSMYYTKAEIDADYLVSDYVADSGSSLIELKSELVSSRAAGCNTTPVEVKRFVLARGGTVKILTKLAYEANPSGIPVNIRVYVNGSPVASPHTTTAFLPSWGQFVDVISGLSAGDIIGLYTYSSGPLTPQTHHVQFEMNVDNPTTSYVDYEASGLNTYAGHTQYDFVSNRFAQT